MSQLLSKRIQRIQPSPTIAMSAKAAELRAQGKDIISLGLGEPDFDTPAHINEAAIKAMNDGLTHYTPVDGFPKLKEAIIQKFERDNQLSYEPNQIIVSCGAKHSLFNLMQVSLDAGDEVIIPAPYWVSYPDMVMLAEATPVIIKTGIDTQFKLSPEQLKAAITPHTKMIILNSPSNPTGVAYTKEELAALGEVLLEHPNILVVSDDIYEHIYWADFPFSNILMACPDLYDRTIIINGASKVYAMTGWRIGYAAAPAALTAAMKKFQGQNTFHACSISQMATIAALDPNKQDCIVSMVEAFKRRHDLVFDGLNKLAGIECIAANGTFYSYPNVKGLLDNKGIENDLILAEKLLDYGVAVVPGTGFGTPGYMRLSCATSDELLEEALKRIGQFVSS